MGVVVRKIVYVKHVQTIDFGQLHVLVSLFSPSNHVAIINFKIKIFVKYFIGPYFYF